MALYALSFCVHQQNKAKTKQKHQQQYHHHPKTKNEQWHMPPRDSTMNSFISTSWLIYKCFVWYYCHTLVCTCALKSESCVKKRAQQNSLWKKNEQRKDKSDKKKHTAHMRKWICSRFFKHCISIIEQMNWNTQRDHRFCSKAYKKQSRSNFHTFVQRHVGFSNEHFFFAGPFFDVM